jgi:valyl-tRNA synthetase
MTELSKTYNPHPTEDKWYAYWLEQGFFSSRPHPDKEPYTIVIPPPNVTGVLHMGHMLNNTIQDILIRRARMQGKEALWVPGTDHASIATEAKVVRMLREQGVRKADLTREQFLAKAWEWKEKYGGIILEQLKKLGASCDWSRTSFTMDPAYYRAVVRVFVDLHRKGHIYRGLRMVNWDCEAQTTVSNEEVLYAEGGEKSVLYSVRYQVEGSPEGIVIATQRPETIMGDTAIAVNPTDERYRHLVGRFALVPLIGRRIPIIADDYVDVEFGTGCLKVTPAHDPNDYEIGLRHSLPVIDTINPDGTLNELCELPEMVGKDRFEVRKRIIKKLKEADLLVESKDFVTRIGRSERTNSVIEPKLSLQWFIRMKEICQPALENVLNDNIRFYPAKFKNTYRHWMENVRDWNISRQLWWGHRIPAYYYGPGQDDFVVAETEAEALELARQQAGNPQLAAADLRQDPDVLDTWASSWLWPIEVFGGFADDYYNPQTGKLSPAQNADLAYYYPTSVLVTAPEILFFWVARMIIAGYEYLGDLPFKDVYLTGIVRDKLGRKMSKSLGNSPDPLDLIAKYSADGVRTGMLFSSPAGNDLPFDEKLCEQGRNFCNKLWNAFRLVQGWTVEDNPEATAANETAVRWFEAKLATALLEVEDHYAKYRISDALQTLYKLAWGDFCSWYLEMVKPGGEVMDRPTYEATLGFFEDLLKLLHPFMPFITEELWHGLRPRAARECLIVAVYPEPKKTSAAQAKVVAEGEVAKEIVQQIRNLRSAKGISPKTEWVLYISAASKPLYQRFKPMLRKLANLSAISFVTKPMDNALSFVVKGDEFYIPFRQTVNVAEERAKLQTELDYHRGFLDGVMKKLGNERFVASAKPDVVANEQRKKEDAEAKIKALEKSLAGLK